MSGLEVACTRVQAGDSTLALVVVCTPALAVGCTLVQEAECMSGLAMNHTAAIFRRGQYS